MKRDPSRLYWHRQPGETLNAYKCFKLFRGTDDIEDEDPELFQYPKTYKKKVLPPIRYLDPNTWRPTAPLRSLQELSKIAPFKLYSICQYSCAFKWKDRAREYDLFVYQRSKERLEATHIRNLETLDRAKAEEASEVINHVKMIRKKVEEMARESFWARKDAPPQIEYYPDGREKRVIHQHFHPVRWRARDLGLMFRHTENSMKYIFQLIYGDDPVSDGSAADVSIPPEVAARLMKVLEEEIGLDVTPKGIAHDAGESG